MLTFASASHASPSDRKKIVFSYEQPKVYSYDVKNNRIGAALSAVSLHRRIITKASNLLLAKHIVGNLCSAERISTVIQSLSELVLMPRRHRHHSRIPPFDLIIHMHSLMETFQKPYLGVGHLALLHQELSAPVSV